MVSQWFRTGLLVLGGLALTACGNRLNTPDVEATIKADIERQGRRLSLREVRCPADITRQAGAYFRCVGELDPEGTFTINVTQQDSQGNVTWEVPNSKVMLNLVKVEASLQEGLSQSLGKRAVVDCGTATYRVNQPGDRFECQVVGGIVAGADTIASVLVKIDPDGNLDWQELRSSSPVALAAEGAAATGSAQSTLGTAATQDAPAGQATQSPKVAPATGPTGRVINRPYVAGDDD
ncbi:MAG: DUF4333 domain-containing protein [Nodosilinea sp.]